MICGRTRSIISSGQKSRHRMLQRPDRCSATPDLTMDCTSTLQCTEDPRLQALIAIYSCTKYLRLNLTSLVWDHIPSDGNILPAVEGPVIQYYEKNIYIAAGQAITGANRYPNGFHRFNLITRSWEDISNSSQSYESRYFTGVCVVDEFLYLIYGWTNIANDDINTISRVNLTSSDFAWEDFSTTTSEARDSYAIACNGTQIYIFGGFINSEGSNVNDLILLDVSSKTFTGMTEDTLNPAGRMGASMHLMHGDLLLFGGQGLSNYYNDMWEYSTDSSQ